MELPSRLTFRLECIVPPDKTPKEAVERVQKFFDYYHPGLEAKVIYEGHQVDLSIKTPPIEIKPVEPASVRATIPAPEPDTKPKRGRGRPKNKPS